MLEKFEIRNKKLLLSDEGTIYSYYNITEAEKFQIMNEFNIDSHSISSALDQDEVSRFETEKDYIVYIWKIPTNFKITESSSFNSLSIGFFIKDDHLIILNSQKTDYLKEKINIDINSLFDFILFIQNLTIKHYIEHLKIIKLMSREIQDKINKSMENEHLLQMFNLSEILVFYQDAINNNRIALNKFVNYLKWKKIETNYDFINDIMIENEQASKQAEIYSQVFAGLMDARGTIVNNNMNIQIKNLTIINIIFLPLNLIASILGMSEFTLMTEGLPWPLSYGIFSLLMVVIGIFTYKFITQFSTRELRHPRRRRRTR